MVKKHKTTKKYNGFTLVEMMIAVLIAIVPVLVVGIVLANGQKGWNRLWRSVHSEIKIDSDAFTVTFGMAGRKSNRQAYNLYVVDDDTFTLAQPDASPPEQVVIGDAVEFIYWDVALDGSDSHDLMDVSKKGTAYALFYFDADTASLNIDYGSYPPSAISGSSRRDPDSTMVLMRNVTTVEFSHTTLNGNGRGCVRATIELTDPNDGDTITVKAATQLRNTW